MVIGAVDACTRNREGVRGLCAFASSWYGVPALAGLARHRPARWLANPGPRRLKPGLRTNNSRMRTSRSGDSAGDRVPAQKPVAQPGWRGAVRPGGCDGYQAPARPSGLAVDAQGEPHPVLQAFAAHLREHLLTPSGRGGDHRKARALSPSPGGYTYPGYFTPPNAA